MKRGIIDRDIEQLRRMLLDKKAQARANLNVKFDTLSVMGRVAEEDRAQISHDEFISLSRNQIDYQQLGLVEEALDRLAAGAYGDCLACGDPIPGKRLRAVPWARYCVPCQERSALPAVTREEPSVDALADR